MRCKRIFAARLKMGWRVVRVVEGARLESVYRGNSIEGSNPSLSAFAHQRFSLGGLFILRAWVPELCL